MSKLAAACLGTVLLTAAGGLAAGESAPIRGHTLEVKERLHYLERIDVTAEKAPSPEAAPLDAELKAILEAATRAEVERTEAPKER